MISYLITPVKSKRDSMMLLETPCPAQRLTFDVAETPILFHSISVNQFKQLQSLNEQRERESLCGIEASFKRQSICTVNSCIDPYIGSLDFENGCDLLEVEHDGLTPANVFNQTINKVNISDIGTNDIDSKSEEIDDAYYYHPDTDNDHDIVTSTRWNDEFCITMLITKKAFPQQTIHQYLIANNNNLHLGNLRNINIIESCDCIPCKHNNWNVVDLRWEKQWQVQQFIFSTVNNDNEIPTKQINHVHCENITKILTSNGILQKEVYNDAQKTFYRKLMKKGIPPHSNQQSIRKKRKRLSTSSNNKAKDKKIMLQHLATWSSSNCINTNNDDKYNNNNNNNNIYNRNMKYLPLVSKEDNGCSYISGQTLMALLTGSLNAEFEHLFDYFVIIDCRYEYEYVGGHINGAVNISDKLLIELLFKANMKNENVKSQRIACIFHCEYSKNRGPQTCKYFRKLDREINEYRYPYVSYPHVYVLQGGYKKFWNRYKNSYATLKNKIFQPYGYISMWNDVFDDKRFMYSQFRQKVWQKTKTKQLIVW